MNVIENVIDAVDVKYTYIGIIYVMKMSTLCLIGQLVSLKKVYVTFPNGEEFPKVKSKKGRYRFDGNSHVINLYEASVTNYTDKLQLIGQMYDNNSLFRCDYELRGSKLQVRLYPLVSRR